MRGCFVPLGEMLPAHAHSPHTWPCEGAWSADRRAHAHAGHGALSTLGSLFTPHAHGHTQVLGVLTEEHMRMLDVEPQFASFRVPLSHEYITIESVMAGCHPHAVDFVKACLHADPEQRLSAEELLHMPYMVSGPVSVSVFVCVCV